MYKRQIADDADLLLKGVERLDQTAHYFLHPGKGCVDLGSAGELARFQQLSLIHIFSKNESASGIVAHAPANIPIISIFRKAVNNG